MDKDAFFREITLRLCSHLKIEEGLHACLLYLSSHMPGDILYLEKFDSELGAMRIVAKATPKEGVRMDKLVPLGEQAKTSLKHMHHAFHSGMLPPVLLFDGTHNDPVTEDLSASLGDPTSSGMGMPLVVEGRTLGILVLLDTKNNRFTDEHAALYGLLREPFFVAMSNTLKHEEVIRLKDLLADDNQYLQKELKKSSESKIVGREYGLKSVMRQVQKVATVDSPVLLLGETGVGKEVIASAIHNASQRKDGPFIKVNSGAIPDTLIDSELFGHEKGAFTGALSNKRGRFERAHGGTIFLDEIGELPPQAQVRMLRVLQEKEIERVGGTKTIPIDIRIIAATNRDLEQMVRSGKFREDLWFRLNVFPVQLPPLRDRKQDIPILVVHFIEQKAKEMRLDTIPTLASGSMDALDNYHWPGNVRELQNVIERALILSPKGPLHLAPLINMETASKKNPLGQDDPLDDYNLDVVIKRHIKQVLEMTNGRVHGPGGAAQKLGINPSTLRSRMKKLNIR